MVITRQESRYFSSSRTARTVSHDLLTLNNAQHPLRDRRFFMKYAIIGSGEIGTALARAFARKKIDVAIANSRGPEMLASLMEDLGPSVFPQSVQDAYEAEM